MIDGSVNPAEMGVGTLYRVTVEGQTTSLVDSDGLLTVRLSLDGEVVIAIDRADDIY